jgi:hypothetical protein
VVLTNRAHTSDQHSLALEFVGRFAGGRPHHGGIVAAGMRCKV